MIAHLVVLERELRKLTRIDGDGGDAYLSASGRGTGSAGKAAAYLVGERDATGREREGVEVLREDPDMVAAVSDSLRFEHKYRWMVVACGHRRPTRRSKPWSTSSRRQHGRDWSRTATRPLRDALNHEHGWSRSDDPARARTQPAKIVVVDQARLRAYIEAANLWAGLEHEADPR